MTHELTNPPDFDYIQATVNIMQRLSQADRSRVYQCALDLGGNVLGDGATEPPNMLGSGATEPQP